MCSCEFTPYDDEPNEESWHFKRICKVCSGYWWGLHCPHDGVQKPCPVCGIRPEPEPDPDAPQAQG